MSAGSIWHRWEPHIHTPGTLLNNQFSSWGEYFDAIERSQPPIEAIAITDYYITDRYEHVLRARSEQGRLKDVGLIFPNVEMRLDVPTDKDRWVNIHLLVSPEDDEHLTQLRRFLARLRFRAHEDTYSCTSEELVRLGRTADPNIEDDDAALRHGASQFKVSFNDLRDEYDKSSWVQENILVAVAGGRTDGTSGVRSAADATLRQEVERFANIIFASSSAQREFWLGLRSLSPADLRARYGGLKPCLHGSDAHELEKVGAPDEQRFTWIKGGLEFDALKQACIDPANRAFVGPEAPRTGTPSQLIDRLELTGAQWVATPHIALNPGLVAIIGARGSGKTALADIIALACDAVPKLPDGADMDRRPSSSFLVRARDLLGSATVTAHWLAGPPCTRALDGSSKPNGAYARARYLSQQFVEELCSASGMTDELLSEAERVVFEAHPLAERDGALNFDELLDLRASRFRQARKREEIAILQVSERIASELEKDRAIDAMKAQVAQRRKTVEAYTSDQVKLVTSGSEQRVARLAELTRATDRVRGYLRFFSAQEQALLALQDEVQDLRENRAPELLRQTQERHAAARLKPEEWTAFRLDYTGDVNAQLANLLKASRELASSWRGTPPAKPVAPEIEIIGADAELERLPLAILEAEIARLQGLVSADVVTQRRFAALSQRIVAEGTALDALNEKLEDALGAKDRVRTLQREREEAYRRVFEALVAEENVLRALYSPLMARLGSEAGTLRKLTFTVSRVADVQAWASTAEEKLIDLRRQGALRGRGALAALAEGALKPAWETGDPSAVARAMSEFRERYQADLLEHANVPRANVGEHRAWLKQFARWLFSTDHIVIQYGIEYDGVDIRKLSPGTRGIVLLLLYLALDDADDCPLIIDQPEENLDPKSVFDELVGLFIGAKTKRQVIMVTHNANLVVNTDADQVIVAEAGPHERGTLPTIKYTSGGLENGQIRKAVCDTLEGGQAAFKERARRLRVHLERVGRSRAS